MPEELSPRDASLDRDAGTPRWVKVSGLIALALILVVVIMLIAGGDHGPGRHSP
jgi:hypothetical protein